MESEILWALFEDTGAPEFYLMYRQAIGAAGRVPPAPARKGTPCI